MQAVDRVAELQGQLQSAHGARGSGALLNNASVVNNFRGRLPSSQIGTPADIHLAPTAAHPSPVQLQSAPGLQRGQQTGVPTPTLRGAPGANSQQQVPLSGAPGLLQGRQYGANSQQQVPLLGAPGLLQGQHAGAPAQRQVLLQGAPASVLGQQSGDPTGQQGRPGIGAGGQRLGSNTFEQQQVALGGGDYQGQQAGGCYDRRGQQSGALYAQQGQLDSAPGLLQADLSCTGSEQFDNAPTPKMTLGEKMRLKARAQMEADQAAAKVKRLAAGRAKAEAAKLRKVGKENIQSGKGNEAADAPPTRKRRPPGGASKKKAGSKKGAVKLPKGGKSLPSDYEDESAPDDDEDEDEDEAVDYGSEDDSADDNVPLGMTTRRQGGRN